MLAVSTVRRSNGIVINKGNRRIFLDPAHTPSSGTAFVSHAHFDHARTPLTEVLASRETAFLAGKRGIKYGSFKEGAPDLKLLDAGHILGSRGLLIDEEIFFTGDFVGRSRAFLKKAIATKCETLIMDTTFGRNEFIFPSIESIVDRVNRLIADFFSRGIPVVLMGYALGKAQIISHYFSHWDPIYATKSVLEMNEAHSVLGVRVGEGFREFDEVMRQGLRDLLGQKLAKVRQKIEDLHTVESSLKTALRRCNRRMKHIGEVPEDSCPVLKEIDAASRNKVK